MPDLISFNVGGQLFATTIDTISYDKRSQLYSWYIEHKGSAHLLKDKDGNYFIDRDPYRLAVLTVPPTPTSCFSFTIILNFLRLQQARQLWESCLPKDPDRLALLTQEADYYRLPLLRDQAIALLHNCTEKGDMSYVNEVLSKSSSCPNGFDFKPE